MIGVDEAERIDIAVVFNHPNWSTVNVVSDNLAIYEASNCEKSFSRFERIDFDAKYIFFDGVTGGFRMQLSVLISEEVDFFVTAACDEEITREIERTKISVMTLVIFAELEHAFG